MAGLGSYDLKTMEKAVKLFEEMQRQVSKATGGVGELEKIAKKFSNDLGEIGVHWKADINNIDEAAKKYKVQLTYMKEMAKQETEREKRQARLNDLMEHGNTKYAEYYERISDLTQGINKAQQDYIKGNGDALKLENTILSKLREKQDILESIRSAENRDNARKAAKEDLIYSLFGTNAQNIQDIKDGTYGMKAVARVFKEAVNIFKTAVEDGIKANYETTENTLNRIIASNSGGGRFGWNRGNFSIGGSNYAGYKQINNAVVDSLNRDNLYNNISNTAVVEAAAKLTSESGFGLEEAIAKGYQDTVIKYIVPYMDTTSEAFESLEMMMPRNFKKCGSN